MNCGKIFQSKSPKKLDHTHIFSEIIKRLLAASYHSAKTPAERATEHMIDVDERFRLRFGKDREVNAKIKIQK